MVRVSQPFSERSILLTGLDFDQGGDIRSAKTCVSVQASPASLSLSLVTALQVESARREGRLAMFAHREDMASCLPKSCRAMIRR